MLKTAAEVAALTRDARASVDNRHSAQQEEVAEAAKRQAWLDECHQNFERHALAAARAGRLAITVPGHDLCPRRLRSQGFVVTQLNRRDSYESHLVTLLNQRRLELEHTAEAAVAACPSLGLIEDDGFLHRNVLTSFMETLWCENRLGKSSDPGLLVRYVGSRGGLTAGELEAGKRRLAQVLERFVDVKAVEEKHQALHRENQMIPQGLKEATNISWENAEDGKGDIVSFSSPRLKWLATMWPPLASELNGRIAAVATSGQSRLEAFIWRIHQDWKLSWDSPVNDSDSDEEGENSAFEDEYGWEGCPACAPSLIVEELSALGYLLDIQPDPLPEVQQTLSTPGADEPMDARLVAESHRLTIRWE